MKWTTLFPREERDMPLIAMNREIGSLGKDVATGLSHLLGCK
jgi:hypothetical protein